MIPKFKGKSGIVTASPAAVVVKDGAAKIRVMFRRESEMKRLRKQVEILTRKGFEDSWSRIDPKIIIH